VGRRLSVVTGIYNSLFISDLDGTLVHRGEPIPAATVEMFRQLGERGVCRAVATGRSLNSARKILDNLPFDYLLFSSGAGVIEWQSNRLIDATHLAESDIVRTADYLKGLDLAFMLHDPIPENHHFLFFRSSRSIDDFERRLALHGPLAREGRLETLPKVATQFIAIEDAERGPAFCERVQRELATLSVIRATSPLDHRSTWIEVFSPLVNKSKASERLRQSLGIRREDTFAIGNDFNDLDMLDWASTSFVVENAPEVLKAKYKVAVQGVVSAVTEWLSKIRN